ncbi:MAG: hypothetical protein LBS21_16315 [Clostridiales bacterium]|jgi:hypothetical protein|nr:hypothetical protein [Clostridiales bacterium]
MTLYETIFARRSVRQYNKEAIGEQALAEIQRYAASVKQIPGVSARFETVDGGILKGGIAPYAILAHSGNSDEELVNIGYTLQEVDLYLQSAGYASVWCGMASPKKSEPDFRILLGFGKTDIALRKGEGEFKRKKITDLSDTDNEIARAVRLAPSAVNFQPWKLTFDGGKITIRANVKGIGRVLPNKLYLYDIGIALKHAQLALVNEGKSVGGFTFSGSGKDFAVEIDCKY